MYESLIRPLLFALSKQDAERAHQFALTSMEMAQNVFGVLPLLRLIQNRGINDTPVEICGISFPNRIGLAAGFSKNAECLPFLEALGFGFIEVGSIVYNPQTGRKRPRLWRLPENHVLNRMSFPSEGAARVNQKLTAHQSRITIPLGISLGIGIDTPLEAAHEEYARVAEKLSCHGAYLVVNISSPNTKDLRTLHHPQYLRRIVGTLVATEKKIGGELYCQPRPVFIKVSPDDISDTTSTSSVITIEDMLEVILEAGAVGLIIGNTTRSRPHWMYQRHPELAHMEGGLSGPYLFERMRTLIARARKVDAKVALIASGGISEEKVQTILGEGADLCQIYTALIYEGPDVVRRMRAAAMF